MVAKIGYLRISRPEKQNPESQRKALQEQNCERIFEDYGSGSIPPTKRKAYSDMLVFLKEHQECKHIVMSEWSRLGRTVPESLEQILNLMKQDIEITSLSPSEKCINDIPSAFRFAVISLMLGSAQAEREHLIERTRRGMDNARSKGKICGRPPAKIDFGKVADMMDKYHLREKQAVRVLGYSESTYYKYKRAQKEAKTQ